MSNQFNMFSWSQEIPFCDDLWLGMRARNIPLVDLGILRPMEEQALEAYIETERTPSDILMPLSALSQMWIYSLYEFLRTWRQRANYLLRLSGDYNAAKSEDRDAFIQHAAESLAGNRRMLRIAPEMYAEHLSQFTNPDFVAKVRGYLCKTDWLFRDAEALRVTLAKHEVPKTSGYFAETPGYGRMNYQNGSMYWFIVLKDGSMTKVDRRELGNAFLGIDDDQT
jgi:hypothetical protein